ncbi:MAG: GAF domain-containing protein [Chloroflexi bacterium]|nr:MAG: GAF domain-containing protein [Chloroflexota bacterium]
METDMKPSAIGDAEIESIRRDIKILQKQLQDGRIDPNMLARQIATFSELLNRVEGEQKQHKQGQHFKALYDVSRVIGSSLDLQTVLNQVMDAVIQLTGAERGFLMLRDDDGELTVQAARNFDQQTLGSDEFKYSRTIANKVLDEGKPILTMNAAEDPRFAQNESIIGQALRSIMATPLRARGQVMGVAYVDNRVFAGLFNQEDLDALDALAGQAAVALDNAMLFSATDEKLAARVDELQQLRRMDLLLNQTLDMDTALRYTLEWACRLGGARNGFLGLLEADTGKLRIVQQYGEVAEQDIREFLEDVYPDIPQVVSKNETMLLPALGGVQSLAVPVRREQNMVGVLVLNAEDDETFMPEQQDLVERIATRAAIAIENARLYAAVQAADVAKSEFVGIVAHDLKVPMTSILGYSELTMLEGGLTERQQEFQMTIKKTVKRMEMLVADLADISRIETGHFFMNETHVSVAEVVQAVKDGTMTEIEARHHTYIEDIEPGLPDMWVDYYRLVQVLTNLVSNAYKYTPEGGTIMLRARRIDGRIQFAVRDTGIGLSEEAIAKLGTKFWRASDEFTRSQPGTGLGYAITSSLVEQMGSSIEIVSEVGKGSQFTFSVMIAAD